MRSMGIYAIDTRLNLHIASPQSGGEHLVTGTVMTVAKACRIVGFPCATFFKSP